MEAMQREFKTSENMKWWLKAGRGCVSLSAGLHAISLECTCSSEEEEDLADGFRALPQKEMLRKQTQQALQKHAEGGQRAYMPRNLCQNG